MAGIDGYTKLILHCNGIDGSTSFPDDSDSNHTITATGNAQVDTAQKKFGTGSALFDGTGDYLQLANHSDFDFGTGDFTIDCWVRFNSLTGNHNQFAFHNNVDGAWQFFWNGTTNKFNIWGGPSLVLQTGVLSLSVDTWYHIAYVRSGNEWYIFVGGINEANVTDARTAPTPNHANGIMIGAEVTAPSQFSNGWMDEIRVSKGTARWTSNFTPPTEEYSRLEILNIDETVTFDDDWVVSTNPESIGIDETVTFDDNWTVLVNPESKSIDETVTFDDDWVVTTHEQANYASKIIHYNPLVVITDTDPVKLIKIDITDPTNPSFTFYSINASGESVRNAKDIVFNDTFNYLYIACADGQILKVDVSDFTNREQIDTEDSNDLLHIATLSAFDKVYAGTDHSTGEILTLDNAIVDKLNTDFRFIIDVQKSLRTNLGLIHFGSLEMDFRFFYPETNSLNTDFRFLAHDFDYIPANLISRLDFNVKINGSDADDVDLSSISVRHQIGEESQAVFKLARRHDELDKKLDGSTSQITNHNSVQVYINGILEFYGNVVEIQAQSETETVIVIAKGAEKTDKRNTVNLPMSSLNETLHPYHVLLHDPAIIDPIIDVNDEDPDFYLGIKVDLGEEIKQRNLQGGVKFDIPYQFLDQDELEEQKRLFKKGEEPYNPIDPADSKFTQSLERSFNEFKLGFQVNFITRETQDIDGYLIGTTATKIEHGLFKPLPNWTYFWGGVIAKHFDTDTVVSADYVGTSLSGYTSDLWQLIQVNYKSQLALDDEITELGEYTVGSAPYREVSTENGRLIPRSRYEDSESALISVVDEHYDYEDYAKQIAGLEYEKLLSTAGSVLPRISTVIELMIDGYYFYSLSLLNRVNIVNTTTTGIYYNSNGFPVSIKSIEINSESMRVTLTCDNELSSSELQEIDDRYPDPDSDEFLTEERRYFISAKYDPSRMKEIQSTDEFLNQFI